MHLYSKTKHNVCVSGCTYCKTCPEISDMVSSNKNYNFRKIPINEPMLNIFDKKPH